MTKNDVIKKYLALNSIRATAIETGISTDAVRRIVVEAGVYTNSTASAILSGIENGKTTHEIAAELKISDRTVIHYLPYSKGPYCIGEKTPNALRAAAWRERKRLGNMSLSR